MQTNGNADKIFAVQTKKKSNSNSLPWYIDSSRKTADGDDQQVVGLLADQQSSFAASWISAHTPWTVHANHSGSCSFPLLSLIHKFGCVCIQDGGLLTLFVQYSSLWFVSEPVSTHRRHKEHRTQVCEALTPFSQSRLCSVYASATLPHWKLYGWILWTSWLYSNCMQCPLWM